MPYISCSKSGSVSGFLVLSHSFQNVQSCTRNHSVPQITVSVVRQMAHNMHIAYIASCIHVKLKIATMLYHCWLYAMPRTCSYNIQWVHDNIPVKYLYCPSILTPAAMLLQSLHHCCSSCSFLRIPRWHSERTQYGYLSVLNIMFSLYEEN